MDNKLSVKIVLIICCIIPSTCIAAPDIDVATGTFSDGGTINITGTGFGTTGPNVVLFDTFEKGTSGANISTVTNSADVANWTASERMGATVPLYTNAYALSGTKSMAIDYRVGYGSGPSLTYSNVQNSDILVSWWQYIPTNRDVPGTNNSADGGPNWKWFWIGDQNDDWPWGSDYSIQCLSSTCSSSTTIGSLDDTGTPARYDGKWYTPLFSKGTWMRVTVAMRNATSGGYAWQQEINGSSNSVVDSVINVVTAHSDDPWNVLVIPGFGRSDNNSVVYIDDVYVATGAGARARVEMGNASTYSASTNLALITPTAWSDTSITATVRQGSFSDEESAYLYVVHADGTMNANGYPVTIGSGAPAHAAGGLFSGSLSGGGVLR